MARPKIERLERGDLCSSFIQLSSIQKGARCTVFCQGKRKRETERQMNNVITGNFRDDFAPPSRVSTPELCRMIIAESSAHRRALAARIAGGCEEGDYSEARLGTENASEGSQTPPRALVSSASDVATRPGYGYLNWGLFGKILKHRQLELEYPAIEHNRPFAIATEKRVRQELYG